MVVAAWTTLVILELIHASNFDFAEGLSLLDTEPTQVQPGHVVIHNNLTNHVALPRRRCVIQVFSPISLPTVGYWPTVAMTGNGELGFDSGEGA